MRTLLIILVGAALAATIAIFGPLRSKSATIRYIEAEVTRGEIQSRVSATGTLNPVDQVEIGSQISGTIQQIYVDFNSRVKPGQVLAQIDPSLLRANRSQVSANVEKARVAVLDAERALRRARDLMKQEFISQVDLDTAETAAESRHADLRQAQAALELAEVNLANTTITSPIGGIVISRNIDVGQTVAASLQAPKLFLIARDLSEMELLARVDEADIGQVEVGQRVAFTVDSYPDRTFEGHVLQIRAEPIEEASVVSYVTVVRVPNPGGKLLPGMTANVTIVTASREGVLRVPNAALRYRPPSNERVDGPRGGPGSVGGGSASAATGRPPSGAGRAVRAGSGGHPGETGARMSTVYLLPSGSKAPESVRIRAGITDGSVTEVVEGSIEEGTKIVLGEVTSDSKRSGTPNPLGGGAPPGAGRGGGRRGGI